MVVDCGFFYWGVFMIVWCDWLFEFCVGLKWDCVGVIIVGREDLCSV